MRNLLLFSLLVLFLFSCSKKKNEYPISPVPFTNVTVDDDFWSKRIKTNHDVTIPIAIQKSEETGRIDNFAIAGGHMEGEFCSSFPFDDSDIYKIIEGAAYSLQMFPDEKLENTIDSLINLIEDAQEEDGYLFTNRTIMDENGHDWIGKERWEKVDDLSHELYNLGHFYEAATAYYQATGKRKILDIAVKSADLVDRDFGYGKIENWPGHQEIEIGLVKLYRVTGEKRYLDLAKFFLDIRGKGIGEKKTYNQSHLPVVEQTEAVGHSVRAAYMWTGMADVAALTGDQAYIAAISKIWEDVVYKKLYITGGIGAEGGHEGFGGPYELPNERAYCETCAAIANVFWNHRMFLMTGDAKYIDVLERSLYNNVLSGVSLSGDRFFYPNPLQSNGQHERSEWFGCACCPSNISRFIPSMPNYIYAQKGNDLYVNLFVSGSTTFETPKGNIQLTQESNMPWNGHILMNLETEEATRANLHIRIPGWASENPVPGDLYEFAGKNTKQPVFSINGEEVLAEMENGYAVLSKKWESGDKVEVDLPYFIRRIKAHPNIEDDRGKVALQLGPLVYCAEWVDYEDPYIFNLFLNENDSLLSFGFSPGKLGGMNVISGEASVLKMGEGPDKGEIYPRKFTAIPYYAWAHRGKGQMMVWIPASEDAALPKPIPTIASESAVEASHVTNALQGINDQLLPKNSADKSYTLYHWWPATNENHWVVYNFPRSATVSECGLYWLKDIPDGGCDLPEWYKLYYKRGQNWVEVDAETPYPMMEDEMNRIVFAPVTTNALKLEVQLSKEYSAGIHEWTVK